MEGTSENGRSEPLRRRLRVIDYQERLGGPIRRWSPACRTRRCNRCRKYSYPDLVILAILNERRRLTNAGFRDRTEMERIRGILEIQRDRIPELQEAVSQEQERTNAVHQQMQVVNECLTMVLREVGDRTKGILQECRVLLERL